MADQVPHQGEGKAGIDSPLKYLRQLVLQKFIVMPRFLGAKQKIWGEVVPRLVSQRARLGEQKMKSTLTLKNKIRLANIAAGIDYVKPVKAHEMQHIDDPLFDIIRTAVETPRVDPGDTPLSNAQECLAWFLSLAPPEEKPRPNPWDLLSIDDYALPDLSIKEPSAVDLVRRIQGNNGKEETEKEIEKHRGSPKKRQFPPLPTVPKTYVMSQKDLIASRAVVILEEIRFLVKRRERHVKLMEEAVKLDWWRAISVEWKAVMRQVTVELIEKVQEWRKRYGEPERVFKWKKMNYLSKIPSDLDFCSRRWAYCNAQDHNPFMLPFGIDHAEHMDDEVLLPDKRGKCRLAQCIRVLRNEEKIYGRFKWDGNSKSLIPVPGYLYNPPPEEFVLKGGLVPSRGSVSSKRSFRTRSARGRAETVFSIPSELRALSRASTRSSARLQNRQVETPESPRAVPSTPDEILRKIKSRSGSREAHFSRGSSRQLSNANIVGDNEKPASSGPWNDVFATLPPRTPPLHPRTLKCRPFTPGSNPLPSPSDERNTLRDAVRTPPSRKKVTLPRDVFTPPWSSGSSRMGMNSRGGRPFTPSGSSHATEVDMTPWGDGDSIVVSSRWEKPGADGNGESPIFGMDPRTVMMCPLPNCSVCAAIRMERKVEVYTSHTERTQVESLYSTMLSQSVARENHTAAAMIQRFWRGALVRRNVPLNPPEKVTSSTGMFINSWFPHAHKCALKIQRRFRQKSASWELKYRKTLKVWNAAALVAQCCARIFLAKCRREEAIIYKNMRDAAATKVQCMARCYFARRRVERRRAELNYQKRLLEAALCVQRAWRSHVAYRLVKKMLRNAKAIKIQKCYRGHLGRERLLINARLQDYESNVLRATHDCIARAREALQKAYMDDGKRERYWLDHRVKKPDKWQYQAWYQQAKIASEAMQTDILRHVGPARIANHELRSSLRVENRRHMFTVIDWNDCQFYTEKKNTLEMEISQRETFIKRWRQLATESMRELRLVELVNRFRRTIPAYLVERQRHAGHEEATKRMFATKQDLMRNFRSGTIDTFRENASKHYMRTCVRAFHISALAHQVVGLQAITPGVKNAVVTRLHNNHLHDLKIWGIEMDSFEAEDKRSERYRKHLCAGKYARVLLMEHFEDFRKKPLAHQKATLKKSQVRAYQLQELCRRLGDPLNDERLENALAIIDPKSAGIIEFEPFCVWWFSGERDTPTGLLKMKLNTKLRTRFRVTRTKRNFWNCINSIGFVKRKRQKKEKELKDAEFAIKNEARQKKMQEERAVKIAKEEKEREEKEAFDAYVEAVAAQNKDYDLQFNKLYVGGNVSDNKWRPPANALRVSRMLGITATSKKAMKKVSKAWAKREKKNKKKKPKKLTEKQKKKAAKKKAKEEAKAKEAADKKAARRKKMAAKRNKR